nr:ApeC-containing protein 3 [Branchiostoma floridae]
MLALKLIVLLAPLFLLGADLASADNFEKTPVDELRERGFRVTEGCASYKHGDQWASATKGLNCACARRRSLCYAVSCLPDTRLAIVKGRWDCVFDDHDDKHSTDPRADAHTILLQQTWMNAHRKETGNENVRRVVPEIVPLIGFGLDIFNTLFGVIFGVTTYALGTSSDQQSQQEVKDQLENLERKIDQLSSQISDLQAAVEVGNQWMEGVVLYGRSEQRLRYLLHYLNVRLSLGSNGQLQPPYRAEQWADAVLSFTSDGVEEILFHLHDMMMGTLGVFGRKPLFLIFEARMDDSSSQYWDQVKDFLEYAFSLEIAGYAAVATALNLKRRSSETRYTLNEGKGKIEEQVTFLEPHVKKWPTGTYGLPMTNTGCPTDVTWREGQRFQDQDGASLSSWSSGLHFPSNTYYGGHMIQKFCMKTSSSEGKGIWQRGSYCIFKKWSCPSGFQTGYVYWDDEDRGNDNTVSGYYPDGTYNADTGINYCCRSDGSIYNDIILPSSRPFYLFRFSSSGCQQVLNMRVTEEYYLWDDENTYNDDTSWGSHPYDSGDGRNHKLWYCYYQPA